MARYRKRPVVVDAEQFGGFYATPYPTGVKMEDNSNDLNSEERYRFYVVTAHGQRAYIQDGDWIIAEPDGRGHYPCKPDIFAAIYEPME
jgi:hypothetical protein